MKRLLTLAMVAIMATTILTGCFSDPVAEEFENYLNVQMVEVNANYEKLKTDFEKISQSQTLEEMSDIVEKKLIVNINDTLDALSKIELTTDEVKEIKAKYVKVIEKYKEGLMDFAAAIKANDENAIDVATAKIDEGVTLLDEYNQALETLAKEKGMEVKY